MLVTKVDITLDDPELGKRLATAEVEFDAEVVVGGFGVWPNREQDGEHVMPPARRNQETGDYIKLFKTRDRGLMEQIQEHVLAAYKEATEGGGASEDQG